MTTDKNPLEKLREPFPALRDVTVAPPTRLRNAPVIDRLMYRTTTDATNGCWLWLGTTNTKGYGHIRLSDDGPLRSVHLVSHLYFIGPVPEGLEIDHLCSVRNCVNPDHLEAVDHRTNVLRGRHNQNHNKATCIYGHPFDEANTSVAADGRRACRTCARERTRIYREKKAS